MIVQNMLPWLAKAFAKKALDEIDRVQGPLIVHTFSNGGFFMFSSVLQQSHLHARENGEKDRFRPRVDRIIFDSSPALPMRAVTLSGYVPASHHGWIQVFPLCNILVVALLVSHTVCALVQRFRTMMLARRALVTLLRSKVHAVEEDVLFPFLLGISEAFLNLPPIKDQLSTLHSIWSGTGDNGTAPVTPQLFLYSNGDQLVTVKDVEAFAEEQVCMFDIRPPQSA